MKHRITSLPALACFRVAAELESFSKAAERLNLTHGAISRAVRLLEEDLGVPLFERRNRAVFLTGAGRRLARAVAQGLDHIDTVARDIRAERAGAPVTVSCEPTLLMRWLIPRMPAFHAMHPHADVRLVAGGGPVRLGAGVDLAIRRNDFDWPQSYTVRPLFDERIGPVCRPDLVAQFFAGRRLLPGVPLLHSRTRRAAWDSWADLAQDPLADHPGQEFEHFYFSLQAAVAGLGVAIGPWHLVRDDLDARLLAAPCGFVRDGSGYVLLSARAPVAGQALGDFADWLATLAVAAPCAD